MLDKDKESFVNYSAANEYAIEPVVRDYLEYTLLSDKEKKEIQDYINQNYYKINFTLDDIRDTYSTHLDCDNTVPQALQCFFESESFEDAIRNAISIGGDSDTIACITGSVAEAYYGVVRDVRIKALSYLDSELKTIFKDVENYLSAINRQGELD